MKSYTKFQCFLTVFLLCFVNLGYSAQLLGLNEGEISQNGNTKNNTLNQIPTTTKNANDNPVLESYSATEMCKNYSELIYFKIRDPALLVSSTYKIVEDCLVAKPLIVNGEAAEPKEFPHMALLGYSEQPDNDSWGCGGSLISNRFVLTAAHCEKIKKNYGLRFATWARLGELDYSTETDDARPSDYKIEKRIIHENYTSSSKYHDIALFRLEKDVVFSAYVRPICLNTDTTLRPPVIIATGWGKTAFYLPGSPNLLKVRINTIPAEECDKIYLNMHKRNIELPQGIVDNLMVCAGDSKSANDTCGGDSGGPIQIKHESFKCMYSQVGITSFGPVICGEDSPAVYTRVSNYIPWIEKHVWPKM